MKKINYHKPLACLSLILAFSSCKVEELVQRNNELLEDINGQISTYSADTETPTLETLQKVGFEEFYYGQIISEEILERRHSWILIRLTEKINKEDDPILRVKEGWYSYATPGIIYLVSSEESAMQQQEEAPVVNPAASEEDGGVNIFSNDLPINAFTISIMPVPNYKQDLLDQKEVDKLLAQKAMNFDGLSFQTKRFDYAELKLGSYRGTRFINCNFKNAQAIRDQITADNDFNETLFQNSSMEEMRFENWKIIDTRFDNVIFQQPKFINCIISSEKAGHVTFKGAIFLSAEFTNTTNGYIKNIAQFDTRYQGCRFKGVDMYSSGHFNVSYENCGFYNGKWQGVVFNNTQVEPSKIMGGAFINMTFSSGRYTHMKIMKSGLVYPVFEKVHFINTNFWKSEIDAWFRGGFVIEGFGTDFSEVDFKESIFEDGTFGNTLPTGKMNMKYADFSKCEFRNNVTFVNCDLTGAKFPAALQNVTFTDCIGNP